MRKPFARLVPPAPGAPLRRAKQDG